MLSTDVVVEHHPPAVQFDYSLEELRAFAARSGKPTHHTPFGFYSGTFGYTVKVEAKNAGVSPCRNEMAVIVRLIVANRLVEIGTDLPSPCRTDLIVRHYMLHAAQDDRLLSQYAQRISNALDSMPAPRLANRPLEEDQIAQIVTSEIKKIIDKNLQPYDKDRARALTSVDTDDEVKKLENTCRYEL